MLSLIPTDRKETSSLTKDDNDKAKIKGSSVFRERVYHVLRKLPRYPSSVRVPRNLARATKMGLGLFECSIRPVRRWSQYRG